MKTLDYSRIESAIDLEHIHKQHIIIVGAGGSYSFITSLARCGIGHITVLDFDTVESSNIVRQGYDFDDIGKFKVDALGEKVKKINPDVQYKGITKNFLEMNDQELDDIFGQADLFVFGTDSFKAQAYGNKLALKYMKPAIWAGWYEKSRTAELFFQLPNHTSACFRCAMSSRYEANKEQEIAISSNANTIFHSQFLDAKIGFITLALLHNGAPFVHSRESISKTPIQFSSASSKLLKSLMDNSLQIHHQFFQYKIHPQGGNELFDETFKHIDKPAQIFLSHWQQVEPELKPEYDYDCPDCKGKLKALVENQNK